MLKGEKETKLSDRNLMVELSYHGVECRIFFDRKLVYRKLIDMALQKHQITEPVWRVRVRWPAGNTCDATPIEKLATFFLIFKWRTLRCMISNPLYHQYSSLHDIEIINMQVFFKLGMLNTVEQCCAFYINRRDLNNLYTTRNQYGFDRCYDFNYVQDFFLCFYTRL